MNGLVAYDSSSDEDEAKSSLSQEHLNGAVGIRDAVTSATQADEATAANGLGGAGTSMIGPTMPTQADSSSPYQAEPLDDLPDGISEQDLIRHLTQIQRPSTGLPPSPPGSPNPVSEAKFKKFLALKAQGLHFNEDLAKKSSFRNPALFATLLERNGLEQDAQYASSLPASVWDPQSLPTFGYKEDLARSQQSIRDQQASRKKQAIASGTRLIEFERASGSGVSAD